MSTESRNVVLSFALYEQSIALAEVHQYGTNGVFAVVVLSIMRLFVPPERRVEALQMLRSMNGRLNILPEHQGSWIQDQEYPSPHILYAEQWNSEETIYEHIRSSLFRHVLAVIELSSRAPEICVYFVSHTKGMELIHSLRGAV